MLKPAFISLLLFLVFVPGASALNPCTAHPVTDAFLIYVDPVSFASASNHQQVFGDRLRFAVETNVQELRQKLFNDRTRTPNMPDVVVIPCDPSRAPHQGSDFTRGELQSLDESRVVLELWGLVLDGTHGRGQLGYVLVPVDKQKVANPAIYTVEQTLGRDPAAVQRAFSKNPELQAYATIAVGTRMFQNGQFIEAAGYLCSGAVKLNKAILGRQHSHADDLFVTEQTALLAGTLDLRKQALVRVGPSPTAASCPVEPVP